MKFLFLSGHAHLALDPSATGASGGAELQVALLATALAARGQEAILLGADTGQPDGARWRGVKVRPGGRFDTGGLDDSLRALPRLFSVLREERPDFVVVYGWTAWLYILCQLRAFVKFRLVFVCALDAEIDGGFRRDNPFRGALFDRGMRGADARFAITEHQARLFRQQGMPCTVTRLLLQDAQFADGKDKSVDLLWVARCHPVKQPGLFLDLATRLPQARCRMICSPQDEELWREIKARAERLPNVEFFASVPYREIQGHFNAARMFVNTSSHEGVPNTFLHSGLGRAAILSLSIDPDGLFQHFQAGACAGGDFEALVAAAGRFLQSETSLAAAQEECARYVREWHDNTRGVEAFLGGLPR